MKLGDVKSAVRAKPFYKDKHVELITERAGNRITGFTVINKGVKKTFNVDAKKHNIKETFIKFEKHVAKLKF